MACLSFRIVNVFISCVDREKGIRGDSIMGTLNDGGRFNLGKNGHKEYYVVRVAFLELCLE
ncbi:MAG: hypothetical protein CSA81_11825 [Acidobacteria bacterium]|nr:MAG: hypothetical protein CSA81_11825 [Acidobacteriota bacterium]